MDTFRTVADLAEETNIGAADVAVNVSNISFRSINILNSVVLIDVDPIGTIVFNAADFSDVESSTITAFIQMVLEKIAGNINTAAAAVAPGAPVIIKNI